MLSDAERRDLLETARSAAIREEFRQLKLLARQEAAAHPMDLDQFMNFLTTMNRLSSARQAPRPFPSYSRVLL